LCAVYADSHVGNPTVSTCCYLQARCFRCRRVRSQSRFLCRTRMWLAVMRQWCLLVRVRCRRLTLRTLPILLGTLLVQLRYRCVS
jgi:hypothetical protein